jgi:hypothetical protein
MVYVFRDSRNPWFDGIFAKQMRLIKSTYDAHVTKTHSVDVGDWPEASEQSMASFLKQGQLT